jgi:hypothetical protein
VPRWPFGLLALEQVGTGAFLDLSDTDGGTVRAYALETQAGALTIVLDNLGRAVTVVVRLPPGRHRSAARTSLATASAEGLSATRRITIGGRQIDANGVLPAPIYEPMAIGETSVTVPIAADSTVILRVR